MQIYIYVDLCNDEFLNSLLGLILNFLFILIFYFFPSYTLYFHKWLPETAAKPPALETLSFPFGCALHQEFSFPTSVGQNHVRHSSNVTSSPKFILLNPKSTVPS